MGGLCHILDVDGRTPVCVDLPTCAEWFESHDGRVRESHWLFVNGFTSSQVRLSTIFVPFDTAESEHPRLFETMIFGGPYDKRSWRSSTWKEAEDRHDAVLRAIGMGVEP